ncbi:gustatory receptor for sugar taste 64e-like [Colias croceus]|uniref:gustatory receptor for sugar taste 64e-like n=1 Tax=Colias crocea TaxID=72248 RepID=UPI001E27E336|nr:gustatory receptor for sugar taste 64e-like [Colias croceus]
MVLVFFFLVVEKPYYKTERKEKLATFQGALKSTIFIGQCFGLNPVIGAGDIDPAKLRFKLFSARCIYSILSIIGQSIMCCISILNVIAWSDTSLPSLIPVVFNSSNCITTILFFRLAIKWPKLCQYIGRIEAVNPNIDGAFISKCNLSCVIVLTLALVEHILSDLSKIISVVDCHPNKNKYGAFIMSSFPWIFTFLEYNDFLGVCSQIINIQCTFNWNFSNLFVICVSIYLTSRFDQVNKKILAVKGKVVPTNFWRNVREEYNRTINMVRRVNDVIGGIIFISYTNNLFFICVQLFYTLSEGISAIPSCHPESHDQRPLKGYEQAVYFMYSFSFLVVRSLVVSLVASRVHSASKEPAYALYDIPPAMYCVEVRRFLDQIHSDSVALSGFNYFQIKRGLVLTIAGTIVTYELVLLQFGSTPDAK